MIDPVDCRISSRTPIDVFFDAGHLDPLRSRRLALWIAPPNSHFFGNGTLRGFTHIEAIAILAHAGEPAGADMLRANSGLSRRDWFSFHLIPVTAVPYGAAVTVTVASVLAEVNGWLFETSCR